MILAGRIGKAKTTLEVLDTPQAPGQRIAVLEAGSLFAIVDETKDAVRIVLDSGETGYAARSGITLPRAARTVTTTSLYAEPAMTAAVLRVLYEQTQVQVFDAAEGWFEVVALGVRGYLPSETLAYPVVGKAKAYLNLRAGASTASRVLELLPPGTQVHAWYRQDDWLYVADTQRVGYVHSDSVDLTATLGPTGGAGRPLRPTIGDIAAQQRDQLRIPPQATPLERQVVDGWNRLGGLLQAVSSQLGLDPGIALTVLLIESGGRAFDSTGRMIIRFENHIFYDQWGREHEHVYREHFQFSDAQRWQGHLWRPAVDAAWRAVHTNQDGEWAAFNFASTLDRQAARLSISMGAPQIMGFNYATLAYPSVDAMFDAFAASEVEQVLGFFSFIVGGGVEHRRLTALQLSDFEGFARLYNGSGQAATYGALLRSAYATYKMLRVQS